MIIHEISLEAAYKSQTQQISNKNFNPSYLLMHSDKFN